MGNNSSAQSPPDHPSSKPQDLEASNEKAQESSNEELYNDIYAEFDISTPELRVKGDKSMAKIRDFEDAVQPHTDEGGDAHYIGDAYEEAKCAHEWEIKDPAPYLKYVKQLAGNPTWRHLEYLAHWMEVSAAPPKWKFIKKFPKKRNDRAARTKVCVIDYTNNVLSGMKKFVDSSALLASLEETPQTAAQAQVRLLIVEDLSRDVVETLGAHYDVDPLFFSSHISDYLFHNVRDRWAELPSLEIDARNRTHFNLQYLRPRYFQTEDEFTQAEKDSGNFNVLRRLDSDRSRQLHMGTLFGKEGASVALSRAKTSLWIKPKTVNGVVTAILLVDPTVGTGSPLWHGYRPFTNTPSMESMRNNSESHTSPSQNNLYENIIYWSTRMTPEDIARVHEDPRSIALPMYRLVVADWLVVLMYMTAMLFDIDWAIVKPHWAKNNLDRIDKLLDRLSPWNRNMSCYKNMISESVARLFPETEEGQNGALHRSPTSTPLLPSSSPLMCLWPDFRKVAQQMAAVQLRMTRVQTMVTDAITNEEAHQAVEQNRELARLTVLAAIFIPLSFTASFLSMSPDFFNATQTIWLFFVLGVPVTVVALATVDLTRPDQSGLCHRAWKSVSGKTEQKTEWKK
ncbi:unnamed protein product [Zymoseptoria tritici ST99CH_1A5]|uniref:Uncharacterized protein n=2 Tax=Zymoseptoria tritici TaxID=1047171 RepID=A0A2H1G5K4_ZYMTR|nr:unnamed protein product [Zymoseptoria tritici ST99CH_1E4]SMY22721.1 unnamed protein product [Zymoseptoria tritici ST99CH_1A5]